VLRNYSQTAASSDRGICFVWPACRVPARMGQPPALKASFSPKGYSRAPSTTFHSDTPGSSHSGRCYQALPGFQGRAVCHGPPGKRASWLPSYYLNVVSAVAYYCQSTTTTGAEADSLPLLVKLVVVGSRSEPHSTQPLFALRAWRTVCPACDLISSVRRDSSLPV